MLVLSAATLEQVLETESLIRALESAFRDVSSGEAQMPVRLVMRLPEKEARLSAMPAYLPGSKALATKLITAFPTNVARGIPLILGVVVLNDPETGAPLALMDGATITGLRTAAASALSVRLLGRPNAAVLGLVGAGLQAKTHLKALAHVRELQEVRVCAQHLESAERFAADANTWGKARVRAVGSPEEAIRGADIVVTATTAAEPIVSGDWLAPGTHICAVGSHAPQRRELDSACVVASSQIVVDTRDGCMAEAGDLLIPIREGVIDPHQLVELGEIVLGLKPGRKSDGEVTLYKSVGMAAMDAAAAALAYQRAQEMGLGTEVSL